MGFFTPEVPLTAVGYAPAFSADQIINGLASEYDVVNIHDNPRDAASDIHHHSEAVYEVTVTVRRLED